MFTPFVSREDQTRRLFNAVCGSNLEGLRTILQEGADVNVIQCGTSALLLACENDHRVIVMELLKHDQLDVNLRHDDEETALICACRCGNKEIVVELLKHDDVDVNLQDKYGHTALQWAINRAYPPPIPPLIVIELVKHGKLDVNHRLDNGGTVLSWVSSRGLTEIVEHLLEHYNEVDVNVQDNHSPHAGD